MTVTIDGRRGAAGSEPALESSSAHASADEGPRASGAEVTQSHAHLREVWEDDAGSRAGSDAGNMPI